MTVRGINDAKHWRDRAAEMRVLAEEMTNRDAGRMMIKLAADYDKLADRAEARSDGEFAPSPRGTTNRI